MGSNTSRLALYKPATSGELVDVSKFNSNFDKLDQYAGAYVCTSGTRPVSPFVGMKIIETDTTAELIYVGGSYPWRAASKIVCTAATRPSAASCVEGQEVVETDTGVQRVRLGGIWRASTPTAIRMYCSNANLSVNGLTAINQLSLHSMLGNATDDYGYSTNVTLGGKVYSTVIIRQNGYYEINAGISAYDTPSGVGYMSVDVYSAANTLTIGSIVYDDKILNGTAGQMSASSGPIYLSAGDQLVLNVGTSTARSIPIAPNPQCHLAVTSLPQ